MAPEDMGEKLRGMHGWPLQPLLAPFQPTSPKWGALASPRPPLSHQGQEGSGEVWTEQR